MKKLILCISLGLVTLSTWAIKADTIFTTDNHQLIAKIIRVADDELAYKELNFLDGPEFILSTQKVASVHFSNGSVKTYQEPVPAVDPAPKKKYSKEDFSSPSKIAPVEKKESKFVPGDDIYYEKPLETSYPQEENSKINGPEELVAYGDGYLIGDKYMNKTQYEDFLKNYCPFVYNSYVKYNKNWHIGWGLAGVGIPLLIAGPCMMSLGYTDAAVITGGIFTIAGVCLTTASIPVLIVSGIKRSHIPNLYNQTCAKGDGYVASLNIQMDESGVGLALQF